MKNSILLLLLFLAFNAKADLETDYRNVPLEVLVPTMSTITKKAFTYSPDIARTTLTLSMPKEYDKDSTYALFKEALRASNLLVNEKDDLVIIVSSDNKKYQQSPGSYSTSVFYLSNVQAKDVAEGLDGVLSYEGRKSAIGEHIIIVSDFNDVLGKVSKYIKKIDSYLAVKTITKTIVLNNLLPSKVQIPETIKAYPYDDLSRLVITGTPGLVNDFEKQVNALDLSVKSLNVRLLITTMSKGFSEEFNIVPLFSSGALSLSLGSVSINTLNSAKEGLSVLAKLLTSHSEVNIHSSPFIQLTEGQEGLLKVGQELPVKISTIQKETGLIVDNIERKQLGLSINLIAKVRPDNKVYLTLEQSFSSIAETQLQEAQDVITNDQTLKTKLLLDYGKIYAVGGLTDTRNAFTKQGFKFLPFLDSTDESNQSQEIIIFIEVNPVSGYKAA